MKLDKYFFFHWITPAIIIEWYSIVEEWSTMKIGLQYFISLCLTYLTGWMVWRWPWAEEWQWRLLDNARIIGKSGEPWYICNWISSTWPFLLLPVFFRTAFPCSGGYHQERGVMPLHDVVGVQLKKSRRRCQVYWPRVCVWWLCMYMLSDLTWLPFLGEGRNQWYIIILLLCLTICASHFNNLCRTTISGSHL